MSNSNDNVGPSLSGDFEIIATRGFDAPRELVFDVWTDPRHLAQWWGPRGFATETHHMDFKPGGVWRYVMHGPDGRDYQNKVTYLEVVRPSRIVFQHGGADDPDLEPVGHTMIATFESVAENTTRLTVQMIFPSAAARDEVVRKYGAVEGLNQTLARLKEKLETMRMSDKPFVIARTFDAPRSLVWKAWTERDRLMQWWGPKGVKITTATLDLRPGGTFHYCMRWPDGKDMWGKFVYREVSPVDRIVWVNSFSDEQGGLTRHPLAPEWPIQILTTATFAEENGKTTVTIRMEPINPTEEERRTFDTGHASMSQGWGGTLDQLGEHLRSA